MSLDNSKRRTRPREPTCSPSACVLYEMLTGARPFPGASGASVIAAIMSSDPPPVSTPQSVTPPAVGRSIARCLRRNRDDRAESAHDIAEELRSLAETIRAGEVGVVAITPQVTLVDSRGGGRRRWRGRSRWSGRRMVVVAGAAGRALLRQGAARRCQTRPGVPAFALAPDGSGVVWQGEGADGSPALFWYGWKTPPLAGFGALNGPQRPSSRQTGSGSGSREPEGCSRFSSAPARSPKAARRRIRRRPTLRGRAGTSRGRYCSAPQRRVRGLACVRERGRRAASQPTRSSEAGALAPVAVVSAWRAVCALHGDRLVGAHGPRQDCGLRFGDQLLWTTLVPGGSDARYLASGQFGARAKRLTARGPVRHPDAEHPRRSGPGPHRCSVAIRWNRVWRVRRVARRDPDLHGRRHRKPEEHARLGGSRRPL